MMQMALFKPWVPIVLLVLGVYLLLKRLKALSVFLILIGGVLMALQVWIYLRHHRWPG